jgi:membrane protein YdbS with pleckstrin-like domain
MAYYTKVLQPDETVKVIGRLHWWIYGRGAVVLLIAVGVFIASYWVLDPTWQGYVQIAAAAIAVVGLILVLVAWIQRHATEIVVTDRRVIFKRGLLTRHTVEMNVTKIETVDVEQGLGGRIWGYGTVLIRGTGVGIEPLVRVGSPISIRNAIIVG